MKKHIWIVCLALAALLTACGKETQTALPSPVPSVTASPVPTPSPTAEPTPALTPVPTPDLYPPYEELIRKTEQGLQTHWSELAPEELGVSDVFRRADDVPLGWVRLDVNGDGVEELLFGEITPAGEASTVFDLFCLVGGQLLHPVTGWEFNRWYVLTDGHLMNEASSSGFDVYRSVYGLFNGALIPTRTELGPDDYRHLDYTAFSVLHE